MNPFSHSVNLLALLALLKFFVLIKRSIMAKIDIVHLICVYTHYKGVYNKLQSSL